MIGAKMLYLIEKESEISYNYGTDAAYCIAGKQIRIPTPSGVKIFVAKQSSTQPIPQQSAQKKQDNLDKIIQRLDILQSKINTLTHEHKPKIEF